VGRRAERLLESLDALETVDHVYRDTFLTLSLCAPGDVADQ
jgi:hypothetical protein